MLVTSSALITNQKGIDYMSKYNTNKEAWVDIVGYEGLYQISDKGRVRSLDRYVRSKYGVRLAKGRMVATSYDTAGYPKVTLHKEGKRKTKLVHRLVMENFTDEPFNETVNHKDGIKTNNDITNLEWCTYQENTLHAYKIGLMVPIQGKKIGKKNHNGSKPVVQYTVKGDLVKEYPSMRQAQRETGIHTSAIGKSVRKGYKAGGHIWKLASNK